MNKIILIILFLGVNSILQAADWSKLNLNIIDNFAIPSFQNLQKNSEKLLISSNNFCKNVNEKNFVVLKDSFHQTMDAWQLAQILRSGPAMTSLRFYRLEMWPDRSNAATKHLRKLQEKADLNSLKPERFAKTTTAVQGLSALERLLYNRGVEETDFQNNGKANFKCHLVQTISQNILSISNELLNDWQNSYRKVLLTPNKENDIFETDKAVAAQFFSDLNTQIQVILTQKLKRPINGRRFRLKRAESWRSQRSLRNIALNLRASKKLYEIGFISNIHDKQLIKKQQALFDHAIALSKELELPIQVAHDKHLEKLQRWIHSIRLLKTTILSELPKAIDIPLGFNSLDGDGG